MGFKTKMDPLLDFKVHNFCKYAHLDNHVDFKEKDKLVPDTGQFTEKKKEMRKQLKPILKEHYDLVMKKRGEQAMIME